MNDLIRTTWECPACGHTIDVLAEVIGEDEHGNPEANTVPDSYADLYDHMKTHGYRQGFPG
jgi:hypothetical protein